MIIKDVLVNGMTDPIGFSFPSVSVSWVVDDTPSVGALSQRVRIAMDPGFENVIEDRKGADLDSICETFVLGLEPRTRYHVRVDVEGDAGDSASGEAVFETAKMDEPWAGRWIQPQPEDGFHPTFVKEIPSGKDVVRARLYVSGLGFYDAVLNGRQVTDELLVPYYSDYRTEIQYQTFDVTDLLDDGENVLEVTLGDGWYKGVFGLNHTADNFGDTFSLMAEVRILYADGTEAVIGTDESWRYKASDVVWSGIYDGERIDRTLWKGKDNPLRTPRLAELEGRLVERYSIPVRAHEEMPVKEVIHTPAGETVLDFGQNFAGYVEMLVDQPEGTTITLDFGEILQEGNFYNENYRTARSQFVYTSDGTEERTFPRFTFFGFRYARVTGWQGELEASRFVGRAVYSSMRRTGWIGTGNPKVTKLFMNTLWGQRSNSLDMPTDCPQRDERLGWTGDAQIFAETGSYNMDTAAFYQKFLRDVRVEQEKLDGTVPEVIPLFTAFQPDNVTPPAVWGDVATFMPTVLYEHYGSKAALARDYPMMRDWVDKLLRDDEAHGGRRLIDFHFQLGDWVAQDGRTDQSFKGGTDDGFIASCYFAMSAKKTAAAARVLGLVEDVRKYDELHRDVSEAVIGEYYTPSGRLAVDTQTGYIVALYSGIYPDKERLVRDFRTRLYKDSYRLTGGFVGAPIMCQVMAENGMEREAYYFMTQEGYPGWMYAIDLGATTIWERWNSVLPDGTISGTGMNSLNHYSFGSVVAYMYRDLAGLTPIEPGFRKVRIAPQVNRRLRSMTMRYDSAAGRYEIDWEVIGKTSVRVRIRVPFGCSAEVDLPQFESGVQVLGTGVHEIEYEPTGDLLRLYDKDTLLEEMAHDPKAMAIIAEHAPILAGILQDPNSEQQHDTLATVADMFFIGMTPEKAKAIEEGLADL